jgi:hypothetical protein
MRSKYLLLLLFLLPIVHADSAILTGSQGQIYSYNITLNKTSNDVGINSFQIVNQNNVSLDSAYQNCTITNVVSCQATFIIQGGTWDNINVLDNGNMIEVLNLTSPATYVAIPQQQEEYIKVFSLDNVLLVIGVIITIIIAGNVIYYELNKREI